jgi:hypothetical protein
MTIDTKAKRPLRTTREFSGASTGKPNEQKSKSVLAREAKERGESRFTWTCERHGETDHYSSSHGACVKCCSDRSRQAHAQRVATPEGRKARNAYQRERRSIPDVRDAINAYHRGYDESRKALDPSYAAQMRAKAVNANAIRRMRELKPPRPETAMPSKETLRECAELVRHFPADAEVDHAIPLKGFLPGTKEWVVSGLHVPCNLEPMEARSNNRKNSWFDPEAPLEFQKPRNSFPGGQFHGEIGQIELMRYTEPTTLVLWTKDEFRAAAVEAGNTAMEALAA